MEASILLLLYFSVCFVSLLQLVFLIVCVYASFCATVLCWFCLQTDICVCVSVCQGSQTLFRTCVQQLQCLFQKMSAPKYDAKHTDYDLKKRTILHLSG